MSTGDLSTLMGAAALIQWGAVATAHLACSAAILTAVIRSGRSAWLLIISVVIGALSTLLMPITSTAAVILVSSRYGVEAMMGVQAALGVFGALVGVGVLVLQTVAIIGLLQPREPEMSS